MQKLTKTVQSLPINFYNNYLQHLPLALKLTNAQIEVLALLFEMRYNNEAINKHNRLAKAKLLGMSYANFSSVVNQLKTRGIILGFNEGFVDSPMYINKVSTEITIKLEV